MDVGLLVSMLVQAVAEIILGVWTFEISFTVGTVLVLMALAIVLLWLVVRGIKTFIRLAGAFVFTVVKNAVSAIFQGKGEADAAKESKS